MLIDNRNEIEEVDQWKAQQVDAQWSSDESNPMTPAKPPQLVVQSLSVEALHNVVLSNNHQILLVYNEISIMYGQHTTTMLTSTLV